MSRLFYHTMQDNAGNLLFDVSGTMRIAGTGTLATIYGDEAMTVILPNPMTNHPSYGSFKCFIPAGDFDFYMAKAGYSFETLTGLQGYGSMAQQESTAVQITGGSIQLGGKATAYWLASPNAELDVLAGNVQHLGQVGMGQASQSDARLGITYARGSEQGIVIRPTADSGNFTVLFLNAAGVPAGAISTTATVTTYATSSDARLKEDVQQLTGALDVVRGLHPVAFRWRRDGSEGRGFLAHEVAEVVDGVITGEKDAVDESGGIVPQMIDYAKLVPYLVSAVKELTQQVEMLQAQLAAVEG